MARSLTDEEIERIVRKLAEEDREEQEMVLKSKSSLMKFLESVGLAVIAEKIGKIIAKVWDKLIDEIAKWF